MDQQKKKPELEEAQGGHLSIGMCLDNVGLWLPLGMFVGMTLGMLFDSGARKKK